MRSCRIAWSSPIFDYKKVVAVYFVTPPSIKIQLHCPTSNPCPLLHSILRFVPLSITIALFHSTVCFSLVFFVSPVIIKFISMLRLPLPSLLRFSFCTLCCLCFIFPLVVYSYICINNAVSSLFTYVAPICAIGYLPTPNSLSIKH